jgi:hypothetical protein
MMKTPMWGNALLILNVHQAHETRKFYKNFIRFSLDIPSPSTYCKARNGRNPSPVRIATIPQGILFLISEGMADD